MNESIREKIKILDTKVNGNLPFRLLTFYISKYYKQVIRFNYILFYYKLEEEINTLEMFKIKSHNRHRSHEGFISKGDQNQKIAQFSINLHKNKYLQKVQEKTSLITLQQNRIQKKGILRRVNSSRNSMNQPTSDRIYPLEKTSFQNELKKYNKKISDMTQQISEVSKQLYEQSQRNKILIELINLIKKQQNRKQVQKEHKILPLQAKNNNQLIQRQKLQIQKILNQKNKIISLNKKIIEQIYDQRKIRILYQSYFQKLQKQIKQQQLVYSSSLIVSLQNKFIFMMTSTNDFVTNGHVLALKKENTEENQKDLMKNSYMCLPTMKTVSQKDSECQPRRKSSKCLGKKSAARKLVKIMDFIATSKALQTSELQLYQQNDMYERQHNHNFSLFRTSKQIQSNSLTCRSILRNKRQKSHNSRYNQRSAKLISIKFIKDMNNYYQTNFDQIVYELFRVYKQLGINIFGRKLNDEQNKSKDQQQYKIQDYFNFDQYELVQQSRRRLNYIQNYKQKIFKFNDFMSKKIQLVQENIIQTQTYIEQLHKQIQKENYKSYEQQENSKYDNQRQQNQIIYKNVVELFGIDSNDFIQQKHIENLVDILLHQQKNIKNFQIIPQSIDPSSNQSFDPSHNLFPTQSKIDSKESIFPTIKSFVNKNQNYAKQMIKTQGNQKKFHQIDTNLDEDYLNKTTNLSRTCKSIFDGKKSLDNIFDNLKTCQNYQRAFERSQFQKQYSKQISKKKRVMFRREAKVMANVTQ